MVSNRNAAIARYRQQFLHARDRAETRRWNQPENVPRQKLSGTGKSSRSARRRKKNSR
jgi:hypothetical protein